VASTRAVAQRAAALLKGGSARQKNDVLWLELRAVAERAAAPAKM